MALAYPAIKWRSFFSELDDSERQEFEEDLAVGEISLGEYMEIMEQATIEAFVRSGSQDSPFQEQEWVSIASAMLDLYVSRKKLLTSRLLIEESIGLYKWPAPPSEARSRARAVTNGIVLARRSQLRSAIHGRIEDIKSGRHTT